MKLIGMLDSPYVRRVAISLQFLELPFEHQSLSVFHTFDEFKQINPVVKAPTLICDDGDILMDSTLILEYAESLASRRSLIPGHHPEKQKTIKMTGLALAACDKTVQIIYEQTLRPQEKIHQPWLDRVRGQLLSAYDLLEKDLANSPLSLEKNEITQASITIAVAWTFSQHMVPDLVPAQDFPALAGFSSQAESLIEFQLAPHGASTYTGVFVN